MDPERNEIAESFVISSKQALGQMEAVLRREDDPHADTTETIMGIVSSIHGSAAKLALNNLRDYTCSLSHAVENFREADAEISQEVTTLLLRIVDLLREVIPAAARGRSDPIPEYSLQQLARISEEMKRVCRLPVLPRKGNDSILRSELENSNRIIENTDTTRPVETQLGPCLEELSGPRGGMLRSRDRSREH